jgi:hypothetical protein
MTTPTGYKFLYNGVPTDFADVFDTSSPGTITTGYTSSAYGLDLGQIFTSGNSGITTNYKYSTNIDLGSLFKQIGIPVITTPIYCYKQAIISWTNTDIPNYYILYRDNVSIQNPAISPYTDLNLTNGTTYTYTVAAVYSSTTLTSDPFISNQPATQTYFTYSTPGGLTSSPNGSNTNINLILGGTLTYNCPTEITGVNAIVVGGGGGGGGAYINTGTGAENAGGGGGGGAVLSLSINIQYNISIAVTIGAGGIGGFGGTSSFTGSGGSSGGTTTFYSNTALGGGGGGYSTTVQVGGAGGIGGAGAGSGGIGGRYGVVPSNPGNGTNGTYTYSGGGGGGGNGFNVTGGGTAAVNQIGGAGGGYFLLFPSGQTCITYGGGGGGGGLRFNPATVGTGGDGGQGIVVLTVPN